MTEYIENPLSGKLRGVTYEEGKIIDVHIRDTDDVVKVFVPVRHGRLNGWISVKDRLPDYFTSVLVWCPGNKCIYAAYRNARQEWYTFDDTIAGHVVVNMVTHWMPMPNPPKGE